MLHGSEIPTDFATLHTFHVRKHSHCAEVTFGQQINSQRSFVIRRQCDQVVEDTGVACGVRLEILDQAIGFQCQFTLVQFDIHEAFFELFRIRIGADVLAGRFPFAINLLPELEGPVKRRGVVVHQFGFGPDFADFVHHGADLLEVRAFGFDPQQVCTVF